MKWWEFGAQVLGALSSISLAWGYAPPKGTVPWLQGSGEVFHRDSRLRRCGVRIGFGALATSFGIQAIVTLLSG
ncbi:MAG TPA: hypothetical protein VNL71_04725 [Chloroflexota bacterium]|nr:hypothetical protein [Chloroflexota bacterium]